MNIDEIKEKKMLSNCTFCVYMHSIGNVISYFKKLGFKYFQDKIVRC